MSLSLRSLRFVLPLLVFAAIAGFLLKGLWLDPREIPSPLIGKPAPEFRLESLEDPGRQVDRKDMLGKVWLLNAWASWCVACREEHPLLMRLSRDNVVAIHGIDYKDEPGDGARWLGAMGDPYTRTGVDRDGRVGIEWGVYGVPESFVVGSDGVIAYKQIGILTEGSLNQTILPLIERLRRQTRGAAS